MNFIDVGKRIRTARKDKGYTQEQLARLCGVTKGAVSHWELGRCDSIDAVHIFNLSKALGLTQDFLLRGVSEVTEIEFIKQSKFGIVSELHDLIQKGLSDSDYSMFERMIKNVKVANHLTPSI